MRSLVAALSLATVGLATDRANAEIISKEDSFYGTRVTRDECTEKRLTLWIRIHGEGFCVRYYLSSAGGEGSRPVIVLNGDRNGTLDSKHWEWKSFSDAKETNTDNLDRGVEKLSKHVGTTAIMIGRIGVDGTSGTHLSRRTLLEVDLMNAALDALRRRYRFEGFNLVGQSGGGTLVFGLAEMRRDVGCLIATSGGLVGSSRKQQTNDPGKTWLNPMDDVHELARNRDLRVIVISDPDDQQVSTAKRQTPMVDRLREEGHDVLHLLVKATDPKRHGTLTYGATAMRGCVQGQSDNEIASAIDMQIDRRVEASQRRRPPRDDAPARSAF